MANRLRKTPLRWTRPPRRSNVARVAQFVSTFHSVRKGAYRVVFILVVFEDYASRIRDEFEKQSQAFGPDLCLEGLYVQAFSQHQASAAEEVADKPWPPEIRERMFKEADPTLLVIEDDFAEFDPLKHWWAIIWLSDFADDAAHVDVRPFLKTLASTARQGKDVIGALHESAARSEQKQRGAQGFASRLAPAAMSSGSRGYRCLDWSTSRLSCAT